MRGRGGGRESKFEPFDGATASAEDCEDGFESDLAFEFFRVCREREEEVRIEGKEREG